MLNECVLNMAGTQNIWDPRFLQHDYLQTPSCIGLWTELWRNAPPLPRCQPEAGSVGVADRVTPPHHCAWHQQDRQPCPNESTVKIQADSLTLLELRFTTQANILQISLLPLAKLQSFSVSHISKQNETMKCNSPSDLMHRSQCVQPYY